MATKLPSLLAFLEVRRHRDIYPQQNKIGLGKLLFFSLPGA